MIQKDSPDTGNIFNERFESRGSRCFPFGPDINLWWCMEKLSSKQISVFSTKTFHKFRNDLILLCMSVIQISMYSIIPFGKVYMLDMYIIYLCICHSQEHLGIQVAFL